MDLISILVIMLIVVSIVVTPIALYKALKKKDWKDVTQQIIWLFPL